MSCVSCHQPLSDSNVTSSTIKSNYIKLYRQAFPKKPIKFFGDRCFQCYQIMCDELQSELGSRQNHEINAHVSKVESLPTLNQLKLDYATPTALSNVNEKWPKYEQLFEASEDYQKITKHFMDTTTSKYQILRIEKVINPLLEREFRNRSRKLSCENITFLFHGSSNTAYDQILEKGFDLKYAAPTGLLGQGIYFAENASYSHSYGRVTQTTVGTINHLLYCKVNLGQTALGHTGLTEAPKGSDSVRSDQQTYCVFDNFQGIPLFIIYYLCV
jgi:hypothetical protein